MTKYSEKPERKDLNPDATPGQGRYKDADRPAPPPPYAPADDGFTLLELMVVIFVMGIIAAWAVVSWASFMRDQELRADAINLHKEILALRAKAVENDDSAYIDAVVGGSACSIKWRYEPTNADVSAWAKKVIQLNQNVEIDVNAGTINGDLVKLRGSAAQNNWLIGTTKVRILINPDTLRADPVNAFEDGRIVLKSKLANKVKAQYCIQRDSTCMKPEIYHQTKAGGTWKRL